MRVDWAEVFEGEERFFTEDEVEAASRYPT